MVTCGMPASKHCDEYDRPSGLWRSIGELGCAKDWLLNYFDFLVEPAEWESLSQEVLYDVNMKIHCHKDCAIPPSLGMFNIISAYKPMPRALKT